MKYCDIRSIVSSNPLICKIMFSGVSISNLKKKKTHTHTKEIQSVSLSNDGILLIYNVTFEHTPFCILFMLSCHRPIVLQII
jgi:hypothetical protein